MTLLEELEPKLASLLKSRDFRLIKERRDDAFGNAMVVAECQGLLLRVVRDRGDIMVELCQQGQDRWYSGEYVLEFITGKAVADLADTLEANLERVADLMNSDLNELGYIAFEKKKADANIQRLFPQRLT
jgi:hypothetical protein